MKAKRQGQKLALRGKVDLISGSSRLKRHVKEKTSFSSNTELPPDL
jgi:hypothetical protein